METSIITIDMSYYYALSAFLYFIHLHNPVHTSTLDNSSLCGRRGFESSIKHCHHDVSNLCNSRAKYQDCSHMGSSVKDPQCNMTSLSDTECAELTPTQWYYRFDEIPFKLSVYLYKSWMLTLPTVNLSFPKMDVNHFSFKIKRIAGQESKLCRSFHLNPSFNVFYDCLLFEDDVDNDFTLTVLDDNGYSGVYSFKMPTQEHFNPYTTTIPNWKTFFYLHDSYVGHSSSIPVTVQFAPFPNLTYKVSLVKCLSIGCVHWSRLTHRFIQHNYTSINPYEEESTTIILPKWANPGQYAVFIQILSEKCNGNCTLSFSPIYEIPLNRQEIWISVILIALIIFGLAIYTVFYIYRRRSLDKYIEKLENRPEVLLVYVAHSEEFLDFVLHLAEYLEINCYIKPQVIDKCTSSINPYDWMDLKLQNSDNVLLMIPHNFNSVSPIKSQWQSTMNYMKSPLAQTKLSSWAAIVLHDQISIPSEIRPLKKFEMFADLENLMTFIHGGNWLEKALFWKKIIKKKGQSNDDEHSIVSLTNKLNNINKSNINKSLASYDHLKKVSNDQIDRGTVKNNQYELNLNNKIIKDYHSQGDISDILNINKLKSNTIEMKNNLSLDILDGGINVNTSRSIPKEINCKYELNDNSLRENSSVFDPMIPNVFDAIENCEDDHGNNFDDQDNYISDVDDDFTLMLLGEKVND